MSEKAKQFNQWYSERMGHPYSVKLAKSAIDELEEENVQLAKDKAELVEALSDINKYMIEMLNSVPVRVAMQKPWINIEHANIALRAGINSAEKHKCDSQS